MTSGHDDEDLVRAIVDNQIAPRLAAEELRREGHDVALVGVDVTPGASEGYEVTCVSCGKTGRMPFKPPEGKGGMCPSCLAARTSAREIAPMCSFGRAIQDDHMAIPQCTELGTVVIEVEDKHGTRMRILLCRDHIAALDEAGALEAVPDE